MVTTPKISPERTKRQSLAFGRNLIVLACLILVPGLWGASHGALTLRWPRTDATIIDANLRTFTRDSSDARRRDEWPGPSSFSLALVGIGIVIGASGWWIRSLAWRGIGRMET